MKKEWLEKFEETLRENGVCENVWFRQDENSGETIPEVRAYCDPRKQIYFLMASEQDDSVCRLEFWIDSAAWSRSELQKVLHDVVMADRRDLYLVSYYSALGCRCHQRITCEDDLVQDVTSLAAKVKGIVDAAKTKCIEKAAGVTDELKSVEEKPLDLPCQCTIEHVAKMLSGKGTNGNCLTIPPVQRGKVWNAARIETLWDSIFRNIPIGALSVRRKGPKSKEYDLLDGQQRSTAIELGYSDFPKKDEANSRYNSILWIDLEKKDGLYRFYVTTAAHPWGYASSVDETKNVRLSLYEQRTVAKELVLDDAQVKPYPCQLYPVRASIPVPYTILRKCMEGKNAYDASFVDSLKNELKWVGVHEQVLQKLEKCSLSEIEELFTKVKGVHDYTVTLLDASSVAESDIALYFTRIGKGGVVPSNEELAYSVLKAKLDSGFRETIEEIRDEYGLATSPRIAALAIRLFKSNEKDFYTGSVFDAVGEMCRSREAGETLERDRFLEFVTKDFKGFVKSVCSEGGLTRWHLMRYATGRNGDVFLMLLLAAKIKLDAERKGRELSVFDGANVKGLAALIFNFASYLDYAIRKILREGVRVGVA